MGTKFTQLKTDLSQNNWLVFVVFLMYKLSSFFRRAELFRWAAKKLSDFFFYFQLVFYMCFSPLWSGVFVNVIRYGKRMEILLYSVLFCLLKSKINPFLRIQFSWLLSRGKGKNIISFFLTS